MRYFELEPTGRRSYWFFDSMESTWSAMGHERVTQPEDANVIFFDLWNGFGEFCKRDVEKIIFWQKPVVGFCFFDQIGDEQHRPDFWCFDDFKKLKEKAVNGVAWAVHTLQLMEAGLLKTMFVRKMSQSWEYASWMQPLSCCVYPGHDFEPTTKEELSSRPFDACWIGNATPHRSNFVCDLIEWAHPWGDRLMIDRFYTHIRLENADWMARHRKSKFFIEADGGGYGSERPFQLGYISPMLKQRNDEWFPHPWTDGVNCIEVGGQWGNLTEGDAERIHRAVRDPDFLYQIYFNGIQHLKDHYSPEARASYVWQKTMEAIA